MQLSDLDFPLPERLIAQHPLPERGQSRLLLVDRNSRTVCHHRFSDLPDLLPPKMRLFRNNATVFKARLTAWRATGGRVECFLLRPLSQTTGGGETWECLLKPGRKLADRATFANPGNFRATVLGRDSQGRFQVAISPDRAGEAVLDLAERVGAVPLPPYIRRKSPEDCKSKDTAHYQTVYADPSRRVAAAAPTAGLHFSNQIIRQLSERGHEFHDLTLHVGLATFQPIQAERIEDHTMHRETYEIPAETQTAIRRAPQDGWLRLAVGTTTVRSIEDFLRKQGGVNTVSGQSYLDEANLFLKPPANFLGTDALLTNFHLPRSTLLCLVGAFLMPGQTGGLEWLRRIYAVAIKEEYRFFSYGDAMLIL